MADFDVIIAGGGPAGCAAAISLAAFAPEFSVCLIEPGGREELCIGESAPPQIRAPLEHLGLWSRFKNAGHSQSYRTLSAWGGPRLGSNEFLLFPSQVGWRLDRARFDAMMLEAAAQSAFLANVRLTGLVRADGLWRVACCDGGIRTSRFVIDATGRSAVLARALRQRRNRFDRLVGCFAYAADDSAVGGEPVIEAFRDGWWYSAAIPGKRRVVACMSDADVIRRLGLADRENFTRALQETTHARAACLPAIGEVRVRPAGSQYVERPSSLPMIGVGDAASSFDPISGQGILKAFRSGIFGSYVAADWLRGTDPQGLARYSHFTLREFTSYQNILRDYYALEQRWPDEPFWRRRAASRPMDAVRRRAPGTFQAAL